MTGRTLAQIVRPRLLLCEGTDEERYALDLLSDLTPEFQVHDCGGNATMHNVILGLSLARGVSDLTHLVILRDAEDHAEQTRQATENALRAARLPAHIKTEIIIVPEGEIGGALEDLLFMDIAPAVAHGCVDQYLQCTAQHGIVPGTAGQRAKARLRAWLAVAAPSRNPAFFVRDRHFNLQAPGAVRLRERIMRVLE